MNQTLTETQELRQYAEERLEAHLEQIRVYEFADKDHRRKVFNQQLIVFIDELNHKCREINGEDCDGGNKSLYSVIDEYQHKFLHQY